MRRAEESRREPRRGPRREPKLGEALALGLLQGPTELLPVSSSAHTTLIPWLAGWSYIELDPELRKSFEVALHLGSGAALALAMRAELTEAVRTLDRRRTTVIALSLLPPVLVGGTLERPIERRLGGPCSIAAGLIAGAVAMALADTHPGPGDRREEEAKPADGLALGVAQALALIPGVSRSGATLATARARGFARKDAQAMSWHTALPVILGAGSLKGWRALRHRAPVAVRPAYGLGAASAFASTWASVRVLRRTQLGTGSLVPYCVYRCALATWAIARIRRPRMPGHGRTGRRCAGRRCAGRRHTGRDRTM